MKIAAFWENPERNYQNLAKIKQNFGKKLQNFQRFFNKKMSFAKCCILGKIPKTFGQNFAKLKIQHNDLNPDKFAKFCEKISKIFSNF